MDFFKINNNDYNELLIDFSGLRNMYENRNEEYSTDFGLRDLKIGRYDLSTKRLGEIYLSKTSIFLNKNVILEGSTGINNIAFYFIIRGNGFFDFHDNNVTPLKTMTNNLFFMHEDYKGKTAYIKQKLYQTIGLHISTTYFENLVNLYPQLFEKVFLRFQKGESFYLNNAYMTTTTQMYSVLMQLEQSFLFGNYNLLYVDAKIMELLSLVLNPNNTSEFICYDCCKTNSEIDKIKEAATILLSDIGNPPTIKELSLQVGINEKKLKYGFREVFGTTVFGYLFDYKMEKASNLILNSQKSIAEIAELCGYDYPSHFSTAFKRRYGKTPKMMQNKLKK